MAADLLIITFPLLSFYFFFLPFCYFVLYYGIDSTEQPSLVRLANSGSCVIKFRILALDFMALGSRNKETEPIEM